MELFTVNRATCIQDGLCAAVCPMRVIEINSEGFPVATAEAEDDCIRCGHCVAVCPTGSISLREMTLDACPSVRPELQLNAGQCTHFLRSRRSIRAYRDKAVPREDLKHLIETARYAPSGHNSQGAEWLVLTGREQLHRMAAVVVDWMRWMQIDMPELAQSLHMNRTIERWDGGEDVILRGAPALIIAHADKDNRMAPSTCTIALTYLELAAVSMGLGSCWAGYFNAAAASFSPLQEALALPEGHQSFGAMMVGYPKFRYQRLPTRKEPIITWRMEQ